MRRIYLDSNATAPIRPEARAAFISHLDAGPANAGSVHAAGRRARVAIELAREEVAALVGARPGEVVFTASGTEANNLALHGLAMAAPPEARRIVASAFEHPSVDAVLSELEMRGFEIIRIRPDQNGTVPVPRVLDAAREGSTAFVALMMANHEVGTLQPVAEVGTALRSRGIPLHTDAVQAAGKIAVGVDDLGAATLSLAAHKLGGGQGAGALVVRDGVNLVPLLRGGAQEGGRRPGTETVASIAAFGAAAAAALAGQAVEGRWMAELRDRLEAAVPGLRPGARVNGVRAPRVPNTSSLYFPGLKAESVVIALDLEGIAVSAGAACSSGTQRRSASLVAMGLEPESDASIRVSLSPATTSDEIDQCLAALAAILDRWPEPVMALRRGGL
jgi:cysteine desulfurase